jgi:hypothetical protein
MSRSSFHQHLLCRLGGSSVKIPLSQCGEEIWSWREEEAEAEAEAEARGRGGRQLTGKSWEA